MNKYLMPIDEDGQLYIEHCVANDFKEAKDKFLEIFRNDYEIPEDCDEEEWLSEHDIFFGDIYDIEEF